jgi:hypothetical protein
MFIDSPQKVLVPKETRVATFRDIGTLLRRISMYAELWQKTVPAVQLARTLENRPVNIVAVRTKDKPRIQSLMQWIVIPTGLDAFHFSLQSFALDGILQSTEDFLYTLSLDEIHVNFEDTK